MSRVMQSVLKPNAESCLTDHSSWRCKGLLPPVYFALLLAAPQLYADTSLTLRPSLESPQPVATMVRWSAEAAGADGIWWYRFRYRDAQHDFRIIQDYGPNSSIDWTFSEQEGTFELEVSARNVDTGETAATSLSYTMASRVTSDQAVVSTTAHPLVLLYSAPACPGSSRMRVEFRSPEGVTRTTPFRDCREGLSMNFYVAGLRPETEYSLHHVIASGSEVTSSPDLTARSGVSEIESYPQEVMVPPQSDGPSDLLLQIPVAPKKTFVTDQQGNLLWYYSGQIAFGTRPETGGRFWGIVRGQQDQSTQLIRQFDLVGMTVLETNAARINEQLAAMGKRTINAFHHEVRTLPDGKILALAGVEQVMTDVQDPGDVDIVGDMVIVLDQDLQVVWTWDSFDFLDVSRKALLNEVCSQGSCPPLYLAADANDWLHTNSVQLTPDGNLLLSVRHQDLLLKVDYANGSGSGAVLWRFGKDGDFQLNSTDLEPWFSHQHDASLIQTESGLRLLLFDDGNTRAETNPDTRSRGQLFAIDEDNRTATQIMNADLGGYSFALGSAQRLPNGNYHFDNGWLPDDSSLSVEVTPTGRIVYALKSGVQEYRSYRMPSLYEIY